MINYLEYFDISIIYFLIVKDCPSMMNRWTYHEVLTSFILLLFLLTFSFRRCWIYILFLV